ncbi:PQQ-binding-like beta-propeller repeat protein [Pendulispora albinea]|uniref:PQQ-binding-like beta-propeller repeat protein n=1 Tax=Pendulispora albinea TaxID=2741071 RepID=A0ABZ2LWR7_9BACT
MAGFASWPDHGDEFAARVSSSGQLRWVHHFTTCNSGIAQELVVGPTDDVFVMTVGPIWLDAGNGRPTGDEWDAACRTHAPITPFPTERQRTARVVHFGSDGELLGQFDIPGARYENREPPKLFARTDGSLTAVGGQVIEGGPHLEIVHFAATGHLITRRAIAGTFDNDATASGKGFILTASQDPTSTSRRLHAFSWTGDRLWLADLASPQILYPGSIVAVHGNRIVVRLNDEDPTFVSLSAETGQRLWAASGGTDCGAPPKGPRTLRNTEVAIRRRRFDDTRATYCALDLQTGAVRTLFTLVSQPIVGLPHQKTVSPFVRGDAAVMSAGSLWVVGTYMARLTLDGLSIQADAKVWPYCDLHPVECFGHDDDWAVETYPEPFIARVPLR